MSLPRTGGQEKHCKAIPREALEQADGPGTRVVTVATAVGYPVLIGRGIAGRAAELLAGRGGLTAPRAWALATDGRVSGLHAATLLRGLDSWGGPAETLLLPERERAKTWDVAGEALRRLAAREIGRDGLLVAFGGGAVGDAAGFVAGTYLRGIGFLNAPTTLLAMVDAAVGGKTGLNLPEGKNLVGVFHQPRAVLADLELLATLPEEEWRNGWAETIKIAITSEPALFRLLEATGPSREHPFVEEAVVRACRAKATIVAADEREAGLRRVLNFGHTAGHAVEAAGHFERFSHGQSVALGISWALELGVRLGVTAPSLAGRCRELLERFGLPVRGAGFPPDELLPFLRRDKKAYGGEVAVVLTVDIGKPILRRLPPADADLREALRSIA
ncbi:MAG: 3-dehydroquinate synthase [Gemmatimonadetes bacterium]|nr:3-dehydroquinate synthase [Gemmatimonadota bacterium]